MMTIRDLMKQKEKQLKELERGYYKDKPIKRK